VQQRRSGVSGFEFRLQLLAPRRVSAQLVSDFAGREALHDGLDRLPAPDLDALDLTLGCRQACAVLHPQTVHLARELVAELLERTRAVSLSPQLEGTIRLTSIL
jgi:hypothetical protein